MGRAWSSPLVRHLVQLIGVMFFVGLAWGTSQKDIEHIATGQTSNREAVEEIKKAINEAKVDAAQAKEKVDNIERRVEEINKKLDTLIWRTSPYNPSNQNGN